MSEGNVKIRLEACRMTGAVMDDLEKKGLIMRLGPERHQQPVEGFSTSAKALYTSDPRFGPHRLLAVTVNRPTLDDFGTHPDNEEFLLLGDPATGPLYIVVSFANQWELKEKVQKRTLKGSDFIVLMARFNDPDVSFFTMLKGVAHGEAVAPGCSRPSTFYVTESSGLPVERTNLIPYELAIDPETG